MAAATAQPAFSMSRVPEIPIAWARRSAPRIVSAPIGADSIDRAQRTASPSRLRPKSVGSSVGSGAGTSGFSPRWARVSADTSAECPESAVAPLPDSPVSAEAPRRGVFRRGVVMRYSSPA